MTPRRLHIGGKVRAAGWEVLDAIEGPHVDHVGNANDLSRFGTGTFATLYASHVLEHFDYKDELQAVLREWQRVLVPGGQLLVSVPDLDVLARMLVDKQGTTIDERWQLMRMVFGGHMDRHDYHLVGLNEEFLGGLLVQAGWVKVRRVATLGLFEDTSTLAVRGTPISLNMIAEKALLPGPRFA